MLQDLTGNSFHCALFLKLGLFGGGRVVLGFKFSTSCLPCWHFTTWAKPPAFYFLFIYLFFCFGDFGDGVLLLAGAGLDHESSIYAFHSSWDDRCTPSHPVFSVENASHECFAQAGLQTKISASWVAKITGVSHQHPAWSWDFQNLQRTGLA
jgi:hypothetical protein